jgi:endonuclease/exonuclease/phosphatase family metal-dependent hydrolase
MSLRVMTLNLLSPDHASWERRREVVRAGLATLRPDVIALQEIVQDDVRDLLGDDYYVVPHSARSPDGVGAVFASRFPVTATAERDLRVTDRVDLPWCAAVAAEAGPLLFVHHKPTYHVGYSYERELQAVAGARFIEERLAGRDMPVVVAGDFDDTPDSASIRFWTGKQSLAGTSVAYRDAWAAVHPDEPGHTFTPRNPLVSAGEMSLELGRRIDYVLVRCGIHGPALTVDDCRLVFDEPVGGVWASDHFGVMADLSLPEHPPGSWAAGPPRG